jgi:hypothetical protein
MFANHCGDAAAAFRPRAHVEGRGVELAARCANVGGAHVESEGEHR